MLEDREAAANDRQKTTINLQYMAIAPSRML